MTECIKPHERLCLVLCYLASWETCRSLEFQFSIGKKTISRIVIDVFWTIFEILGQRYVNTPRYTRKWLEIPEICYQQLDFLNGIGDIDGKHMVMEQLINSGSHYRNYKGTDSIILLAMIGLEYEFLYDDGCNSDGGVWSKCELKNILEQNTLNVPTPTVPPGSNVPVQYLCTSDEIFPFFTSIMNLHPQSNLTVKKQIFSYRLSRIRRVYKNDCGILANTWRVFRRSFTLEPEKVKTVTFATLILRNWLWEESKNRKIFIPKGCIDYENIETGDIFECSWRADDVQASWYPMSISRSGCHSTNHARELREECPEYFMNEGCVSWQWKNTRVDF